MIGTITSAIREQVGVFEHEHCIAHLLRRTGFLATKEDVDKLKRLSIPEIVERMLHAPPDIPANPTLKDNNDWAGLQHWWINHMRKTSNPLQEKMILFWHNNFTSALNKVGHPNWMAQQNQLFRKHAMGNFRDLTYQITIDPAMMVWLDNYANISKAPNENYAREMMELFTLGIGNYTETDVKQAAKALTGWRLDWTKGTTSFNKGLFDNKTKTIFGQTGNYGLSEMVDLLLAKPACANHITKKLWKFFVYPDPSDAVIEKFAAVFRANNYEIKALLQAIFTSDEFYSDKARYSIIKDPSELVVGVLRTFPKFQYKYPNDTLYYFRIMGQELFNPPHVAGWSGGQTWLDSSKLFARYNFISSIVDTLKTEDFTLTGATVEEVVQNVLNRVGLFGVSPTTKQQLNEYAREVFYDKTTLMRGLLHLSLVSPEYQMK